MNLRLFAGARGRDENSKSQPLWHAEYPIEQTLRSQQSETRLRLIQEPWRRRASVDTVHVADHGGLRILGRCEDRLQRAVATLMSSYRDTVVVEAPIVRMVHGIQMLEPWMDVLVNVRERYCDLVESDFIRRRGSFHRLSQTGGAFVLEGEAPLADLLGYTAWLRELTGEDPNVAMWLSRYLPVDCGPKAA